MTNVMHETASVARGARRLVTALLLGLPLVTGCSTDRFLKVTAPSSLPADRLQTPQYAPLLVNGAVADFECAYGSFVLVEGIISDELADSQLGAAGWPYDRRDANTQPAGPYGVNSCSNNQTPGVYTPISTARWDADNVLTLLQGWTDQQVPNRQALIAKAALYGGFSYTIMGMAMCSAAVDGGPELSQQDLFGLAEQRFSTAIDAGNATGQSDIVNAALLGRARVRLFMGDKANADADAKQVPAGFDYDATFSADNNRRYNRVYASNIRFGFYTVEPLSRGLTTDGVVDPRTKSIDSGVNGADGTIVWYQQKYTDFSTPIPMARYAEAQLIIAEVEGGQTAVDIINQLRDNVGLPHFQSTDPAVIQQTLIEERRRELWLEGQRNYDIERFNLPQEPAPGTPFPAKGGFYGTTTCLPLPDVERYNNPNIH
jgi:starch-binding outer membrane protein, SusD/RagB family